MSPVVASRYQHTYETLSSIAWRAKRDQRLRREYYQSASFFRSLESGRPTMFRVRGTKGYAEDLASFGGIELMESLVDQARRAPAFDAGRLYGIPTLTIGYVGSAALFSRLAGSATFRLLDLDALDLEGLDFVLVGAPVGNQKDSWATPLGGDRTVSEAAERLGEASQQQGIPLIVLSASDPLHLAVTLDLARHAHTVFCLDEESAERCREQLPEGTIVELTPPFFSPRNQSPIGRNQFRMPGAIAWGAQPNAKQGARIKDSHALFEGFPHADVPLTIVDDEIFREENPTVTLPWQFAPYAVPAPPADLEFEIRKLFDIQVLVNLNPTQGWGFPLETVPALAMGSLPLATYSGGMNNVFPSILLPDGPEDVCLELEALAADPEALLEQQITGIRRAFESFTADRFIERVATALGLSGAVPQVTLGVSATSITDAEAFIAQQFVPDRVADVIPIEEGDPLPSVDALIKVRPDTDYGPYLMTDVVHGFAMASADGLRVNRRRDDHTTEFEVDRTPTLDWADALWLGGRPELPQATTQDPATILTVGGHQASERVSSLSVATSLPAVDPTLTVIVPVYNNGRYLRAKCFESLRRSSIFDQMKVLLIDDGSSDAETLHIVRDIEARYPNVEAHFFPTGGSGSASRPRNRGLELTTTEFVTYLDPDNEATGDGYARLLRLCQEHQVDFAIGDMLRLAKRRNLVENVAKLAQAIELDEHGVGEITPEVLPRLLYQPMSIQALVARTDWLQGLGIEQPVGALGQDSLFFQMMLHNARTIAVLEEPIHSYYGEVAGSMVNTIGPSFFRKYLPLEEMRSEWLRAEGYFDHYCEVRALHYFRVWFWPRFNDHVAPEEKEVCFEILQEIAGRYGVEIALSDDGMSLVEVE